MTNTWSNARCARPPATYATLAKGLGEGAALEPYESLKRMRPWHLIRSWCDFSADPVRLLTIQTAGAYEQLRVSGLLEAHASRAEADFARAYGWMLEQMNLRLATPTRSTPVWLWARTSRRGLWANVRAPSDHGEVLLQVAVPRRDVLLSDFDGWHNVLNGGLHAPCRHVACERRPEACLTYVNHRYDAFEAQAEAQGCPSPLWPDLTDDLRAEVQASWDLIFDPVTWHPHGAIQATIPFLEAGHVTRAWRIPAEMRRS